MVTGFRSASRRDNKGESLGAQNLEVIADTEEAVKAEFERILEEDIPEAAVVTWPASPDEPGAVERTADGRFRIAYRIKR
jgi:hypothetical protein